MKLLKKEIRLAASPMSFVFIAFGLLALAPGYPILVGAFFLCFGIFHSFQNAREANDILYSALLPIKKSDVVRAKYIFTLLIQALGFLLFALCTLLRLTVLVNGSAYVNNPLLAANFTFLAFVLLVYSAYNTVFLGGFFKTAYYYNKPFITFAVVAFLIIALAETVHHIPGLTWLNATSGPELLRQLPIFIAAVAVYIASWLISLKRSCQRFENIDIL